MTQNLKIEVLTGDISIDGMVVTNLVTKEELSTAIVKKADLGTDGKIPTSQLPAEIVNTAGIVDEVKLQLETSIKDAVDESNAYAESYTDNALSSKADLTSGKVPLEQLPAIDQYPQFGTALSNLSTSILTSVKQRTDQLEKTKADLGEDGKVLREQIPSYEKISGLPEQLEVMTTQTAAVSGELGQHKLQTADQIDTLKENIEANVQQLSSRQSYLMRTYATKELGVDAKVGVKPGEYFYVRSANEDEMLIEYQNVSGVPTPTGSSYPSSKVVEMARDGVNTIADLLAIQSPKDGMRVSVKGYHTPTLFVEANPYKGGGTFVWDAASTATPDNGIVFAVNSVATGRWIRQLESDGFVTPQMFGAKATGLSTDDDYPAIMAAINYASTTSIGTVFFPKAKYYSSQDIQLKRPVKLLGESVGLNIGTAIQGSVIYFPRGKDGITVNGARSLGWNKPEQAVGSRANGTIIKGITVTQDGYSYNSQPVIDYNPTTQQFLGRDLRRFANGSVIVAKNENLQEKARATVVSSTAGTRTITVKAPISGLTLGMTVTGLTSGATGVIEYLSPNAPAIGVKNTTGTFSKTEVISTSAGDMQVTDVATIQWAVFQLSNITGSISVGDIFQLEQDGGCGIILLDRATVEDVYVTGFADNAFFVASTLISGLNANCSSINTISASQIGRHGFSAIGNDANAAAIVRGDFSSCSGYGVYDESFLGNYFFGCHTSANGLGAYYSRPQNSATAFVGCYSEGSTTRAPFYEYASRIGLDSTLTGGIHGAQVLSSYGDVGVTNMRSKYLRVSNGMYPSTGFQSVLSTTMSFRNAANGYETLALCNSGSKGAGRGTGTAYFMPVFSSPHKDDNSDLIKGGVTAVSWLGTSNSGTAFSVDLTRNESANSLLQLSTTPSNTATGNAAVAIPIISGGIITGLDFKNFGKTYTEAPVITGTGSYAGFSATTKIYNGTIVDYEITSPATATNLQGYNLQRALNVTVTSIASGLDNVATLGTAANRWSQVYAGAGTINTSDERENQQIRDLSEAEKRVAVKLKSQIKAFKFNDAVTEKGDNARIHFGVIAQEVKAAFESEGLVAENYAILCYDEWDDEYREITEEITVTNDAGEEVTETVETGERELIREAGNRYGVRYEELLAFIISAI